MLTAAVNFSEARDRWEITVWNGASLQRLIPVRDAVLDSVGATRALLGEGYKLATPWLAPGSGSLHMATVTEGER